LFSLYLRPFDIEGKLLVEPQREYVSVFSWWGMVDRPGKDALERLLADAVKRTAPLVGLGSHGKIEFGFGSAGLAPDWKDRVSKIMETASYIFVVPSAHEGTLWELGEIKKKGYFDKSVFIMPRVDPPFQYSGAQDYKQVWDEARAACEREHG